MVKLAQLDGAGLIVLFQKAKSFTDDLAGRVVASGFDLGAHELFELGGSSSHPTSAESPKNLPLYTAGIINDGWF